MLGVIIAEGSTVEIKQRDIAQDPAFALLSVGFSPQLISLMFCSARISTRQRPQEVARAGMAIIIIAQRIITQGSKYCKDYHQKLAKEMRAIKTSTPLIVLTKIIRIGDSEE